MKTLLLAALVALPAAASATPAALEQLQQCAAGYCWDTKGQPVAVPPPGALIMKEPAKLRPLGDVRPAEPPRYTVFTHEEVQTMRRHQKIVGTAVAAACGAMMGAMLGGIPGAVIGGLLGAAVGYLLAGGLADILARKKG